MEVWLRRAKPSSELGYCTTSGGRGGGAPVGGAPGAEPSARAGLWKRGDSLRGARRPAPLHGQFSQAHLPHLPAHEGERSTQDEAALRGGRGASSDSPHHLRRAILLIRLLAGGQGRRVLSSEAKQRGAEGSGGGQAAARAAAARARKRKKSPHLPS